MAIVLGVPNFRFFTVGKKNRHSSVYNADQEVPTLVSIDNAGNSVNLVSGIIFLPSGWDFQSALVANDKFYFSPLGMEEDGQTW